MPMPSPPMKVDWPPSTPGMRHEADLDGLVRGGEQRRRVRHHADLALLEVTDPGGAGLLLGGGRHGAGLVEVAPHRVDLLGGRAVEVRGGAVFVHRLLTAGPDHREPGENSAAAAVAAEVGAVHARLVQLLDGEGVLLELGQGGRALVRVQPGLLVERLVVEDHREVEHEGQHVLLVLVRAGRQVPLVDLARAGQRVDPAGEIGEQSRLGPVGDVDDVGGEQVRQVAAAGGRPDPGDVVVVGRDGQLDLVLVGGVVGLHESLGLGLQRRPRPERQLGAVVDPVGVGGGAGLALGRWVGVPSAGGEPGQQRRGGHGDHRPAQAASHGLSLH